MLRLCLGLCDGCRSFECRIFPAGFVWPIHFLFSRVYDLHWVLVLCVEIWLASSDESWYSVSRFDLRLCAEFVLSGLCDQFNFHSCVFTTCISLGTLCGVLIFVCDECYECVCVSNFDFRLYVCVVSVWTCVRDVSLCGSYITCVFVSLWGAFSHCVCVSERF